ncbi:MAG: class I SAM-dependent methyltransferase [Candidatus Asgardarchaeia archaeon]
MEHEYTTKWNNYKVGKVKWINTNRYHPCREEYVNYIIRRKDIKNILEVGGGEMREACLILEKAPYISYSTANISDFFLDMAREVKDVKVYKADMVELPFKEKSFDIIYMSSVIEHSPNICKTIKEVSRVSKEFYFNLFMWRMGKNGDLESKYIRKKKYYSTPFNIFKLMNLISKYGVIEQKFLTGMDTERTDFNKEYFAKNRKMDIHRDERHLTLTGRWN